MNLTTRLLIAFFGVVLISGLLLYDVLVDQVELGISQSTEETMVDTAHLVAELIEPLFVANDLSLLSQAMTDYADRSPEAVIFDVIKHQTSFNIYVTDAQGIVLFDSTDQHTGADFSEWNDVLLTLKGRYGARATRLDPNNEFTTVLHVAAPIVVNDNIAGVVSVTKSKLSLQPYVERIQQTVLANSSLLLFGALGVCLVLAFWLTRSIRQLVSYANNVVGNRRSPPPEFSEPEFRQLSQAMTAMRHRLDGKEYVEEYIETLTHEIKSPVAAIKGALELIDENMANEDRQRFLSNIQHEANRLEEIAGRLLHLASLEHRDTLSNTAEVDLAGIVSSQINDRALQLEEKHISTVSDLAPAVLNGDSFLITQAVSNLLDNAIKHAPEHTQIEICLQTSGPSTCLSVTDHGMGIPGYAKPRVFERFYSLPHPVSGKKSTGLGLSFVKQIADLHDATILLEDADPGCRVKIIFDHTQTTS
jgi:two-component system, OmpR family, sensor histidine kinase CreC